MTGLSWSGDGDEVVAESPEGQWRITRQSDGWRIRPPGVDDPEAATFWELDQAKRFAQHLADRPG
ncbi:hypothetical protein ACFT5B_11770 [Luteimicrobium sp. NPDC057192]|uniref:hypothetical protein n=1 Tax=Luteimicrobium sp. NPDC057192 TaxID=3346042 RepID=UPI00362B0F8B